MILVAKAAHGSDSHYEVIQKKLTACFDAAMYGNQIDPPVLYKIRKLSGCRFGLRKYIGETVETPVIR